MIRETLSDKQSPALTSNRWHVIHARWDGVDETVPHFDRTIVSEHDSNAAATVAARSLWTEVMTWLASRPRERHDHVLVRPPDARSLKHAKRPTRRPK